MYKIKGILRILKKVCHQFFSVKTDQNGQTMAEYALALIFIGLAAMVILRLFPSAIKGYLDRIYYVVSLPLP
jgi:hypothetical protein